MSRSNLLHALSSNEFCRHDQLLRRKVRFLDSADSKFSQMHAQFFRKLAHSRQPWMQDFTNGVIEAGNADVIRNSGSRILQRLVHTRGGLIGPDKECGRALTRGQQSLDGQVSQFAIFRADLTETGFEVCFLHRLPISASAPRKPG